MITDPQGSINQQMGDYRLLRPLGNGTFGTVYLAEHLHDHSHAAVKVLQIQLTSQDNLRDFLNEARTIHLHHPHIVPVLDFGLSRDGQPFLVMEYAAAGTLRDRHPKGSKLPGATIATYVQQITSALQYAHDHRLIHRDVKPENMLLRSDGTVLLSDFGIAKIMEQSNLNSMSTQAGTPAYMAPEQSQGKPCPASDQYTLAIIVYEWFCGSRPFQGDPLAVMLQHRIAPPPPLHAICPEISLQVEQVIFKALAKAPTERFPTVTHFAEAFHTAMQGTNAPLPSILSGKLPLQKTTLDETVPPTPSALGSLLGSNSTAVEPAETSQSSSSPESSQPLQSNNSTPPTSDTQSSQRRISRRILALRLAGLATVAGSLVSAIWLVSSHTSPGSTVARRSTPTVHASSTASHSPSATSTVSPSPSPTGTTSPSPTNTASPTPKPTSPPQVGTLFYSYSVPNNIRVLAWSPDGKRIALGCDDYTARVWDASTGSNVLIYRGHTYFVEGIAWSPDSSRIASGSADATVQIWNPTNGNLIYTYHGHSKWVNRISWSPNGKYIASCDQASKVLVWDVSTGTTLVTYSGHTNAVYAVAWSPDGNHVASCGYDNTLQVWGATTGTFIAKYTGSATLLGLSWSPNSPYIAVGGNVTTVLNATTGKASYTYNISSGIPDVSWSIDGSRIAVGSNSAAAYVLNATTGATLYTYSQPGHIDAIAWSPDSQRVASGGNDGLVQVWQAV